ncbi:hypothetical protein VKS41_006058 [Umbelopsis sp. WA50703]
MSAGVIIGLFMSPSMTDRMGRKPTIIFGSLITLFGVALQSGANNSQMFIAARFFIGFGQSFTSVATPLLMVEIIPSGRRGVIIALMGAAWYLGAIVAAWLTYGTARISGEWSWRLPSLFQALPSLTQIFGNFVFKESPRWLVAHDRKEEALAVLAHFHANGDKEDEKVQVQYKEVQEGLRREHEISKQSSYAQLFSTPGNRKRLAIGVFLALAHSWSGNGLITHYLSTVLTNVGIHDSFTQLLINGLLQIWNLLCACASSFVVDSLGRKTLLRLSTVFMLIFLVVQTICTAVYSMQGTPAAGYASIATIFLFFAAYDIGIKTVVGLYGLEILPFTIRAKATALLGLVGNFAVFVNIYANPVAFAALGWKLYVIYCCWVFVEVLVVWIFLPETKGKSLEELLELFDGRKAALVMDEINQINELGQEELTEDEHGHKLV